ncbi:MAG: hypothetical protein AAGD05_17365, partial [Bacteroidota bacterium]
GVGMAIYLNLLSSEQVISKSRANLLLTSALEQHIRQENYVDERVEMGGWTIEKQFVRYAKGPQHYQCVFRVFGTDDRLIHEIKRVVLIHEKQIE